MTEHLPLLVSTAWLADHLDQADVVVLDASHHLPAAARDARADFAAEHIPGAQFLDLASLFDATSPVPYALPQPEQQAMRRAALTMNIGISRLLDERANRPLPVSAAQQQALDEHPLRSMVLLHRLGITDNTWLDLVRDHHEMPDGSGYPARKRGLPLTQQVLRLCDAMFEHHSQRPGITAGTGNLPPAARTLMLDDAGKPHALGAAWLRRLGLYLPGSFVQLANGEIAAVVRRGAKATAPRLLSLVSRQGSPLGEPMSRDGADPDHEVRSVVPRASVKVNIDPRKLLARI